MKNVLVLFAIATLCMGLKTSSIVKTYDLEWAIENKLISCEFRGNDESPHYYQPLVAELTNLTDNTFNIKIPNGQKFKSASEEHQDIIITQEELIAVSSRKNLKKPLFGMCIERYNTAPNSSETYTPNGIATENLSFLAKEIEKQKAYGVAGQNAVWNVTDDGVIEDIAGYDIDAGALLREYTADLLDIPEDEFPTYIETQETLVKRTAGGNFRYKFSKTSSVTIGMFNNKDIIVKELYNNPETPAGEHRLSYEFDTLQYPDDVYYIRLIINGQIKINFEMKSRRS